MSYNSDPLVNCEVINLQSTDYCCLSLTCGVHSFLASLQQEKEKAMVSEMIGKLTSACWDKCITGTPGSKFSSSESNCLTNCAQRYMDMSLIIMKRFQQGS
ncbi:Mitochondrial import inner membrane translocase subunit TIM8 [Sesamum angolense]|uniref:Mitochondrial import inner membrane translocase subunit n=1 Tax=Sesamum angolense TaxID=2727404 RepID=A0AAE2BRX5_9LAMI|nr:Mitochondrial import inner membrane translocase subunit TIM8 [Sesamum angolense]